MRRYWQRIQSFVNRLSPVPIDTSMVFGLVLFATLVFAAVIATKLQKTYSQVVIAEKTEPKNVGTPAQVVSGDFGDWSWVWVGGLYAATAIVGIAYLAIVGRRLRRRFAQWRTRHRLHAATKPDEVQVSLTRLAESQFGQGHTPEPASPRSGFDTVTSDSSLI